MTEAELTRRIVRRLNELDDCFAVKIHGGPHQTAGLPDVIVCFQSIFIGLEVKRPGKERTLTDKQKYKLRRIQEAGGVAAMVTTVRQAIEVVKHGEQATD